VNPQYSYNAKKAQNIHQNLDATKLFMQNETRQVDTSFTDSLKQLVSALWPVSVHISDVSIYQK
jgi:hypothetical protein